MFFAPLPVLLESPLFAYLPSFDRFQIEIENFGGIAAVRGGAGEGFRGNFYSSKLSYRTQRIGRWRHVSFGDCFARGTAPRNDYDNRFAVC